MNPDKNTQERDWTGRIEIVCSDVILKKCGVRAVPYSLLTLSTKGDYYKA